MAPATRDCDSDTVSVVEFDADVVVVGSGFGGAVTALRLTEAGHRVLILEKGRRLTDDDLLRARRGPRRERRSGHGQGQEKGDRDPLHGVLLRQAPCVGDDPITQRPASAWVTAR